MLRLLLLSIGVFALVSFTYGDEAIAPDTVQSVKQATVYIHVEGNSWSKSGSGFVVRADAGTVFVVTNHHVAVKRPAGVSDAKPSALKVVFDSGSKSERSYSAEVVAADDERDLAVLKITGVKDAPKPIGLTGTVAPYETMAVYSFGFPFGQELSPGKGHPAVTVGRASISSLRTGDDGVLATIQIDGNLNPGNSGGPVVDSKGRLVGVAVAIRKDGQGIGFLVPAEDVTRTMEGRLGRLRVVMRKGAEDKPNVHVEADIIDPAGTLSNVTAYYVLVPPRGKPPETTALDKHPGSQKLALKIDSVAGKASAAFTVEKAEGEVVVQVVVERSPNLKMMATTAKAFSISGAPRAEDLNGPPPEGWTSYLPKDKSFEVWLPAKPAQQDQKQRNVAVNKQTMRVSSVVGKTAAGLTYHAEYLVLPPSLAVNSPARLHGMLRAALLDEGKGRFTESVSTDSGSLHGVQYRNDYGSEFARARVFISRGGLVRLVRVMGSADQVASPEADTILLSFRLPGEQVASKAAEPLPGEGTLQPPTKSVPSGKQPTILGSARDPQFKTVGPAGAVLIGVEARFEKFGALEIVRAVRPIYRVDGKETLGKQFGDNLTDSVTLKAKDGYAVGGVSGKALLWCLGFSFTYMKVKPDGTLDPKESYDSEWIGWNGQMGVTKVTGDGLPVIGLVGKIVGPKTTALGLLFKGQEDYDPQAPPQGRPQEGTPAAPGKDPIIVAGGRNPVFKELAPEGGVLVGLEIALGTFAGNDVIKSARPLFRVGSKDVPGEFHGAKRERLTTLLAKPGYAVGALSCKSGLNFDGVSLTFMKVKPDGSLDPKDAYESDWLGWAGSKPVTKLGGDGTLVVGIVGRASIDLNGLGLLFKGQEAFDPARLGR